MFWRNILRERKRARTFVCSTAGVLLVFSLTIAIIGMAHPGVALAQAEDGAEPTATSTYEATPPTTGVESGSATVPISQTESSEVPVAPVPEVSPTPVDEPTPDLSLIFAPLPPPNPDNKFAQTLLFRLPDGKLSDTLKGPGAKGTKIPLTASGFTQGDVTIIVKNLSTDKAVTFKLYQGGKEVNAVASPGKDKSFTFDVELGQDVNPVNLNPAMPNQPVLVEIAVRAGKTDARRIQYRVTP
jgi:hypothetical protein